MNELNKHAAIMGSLPEMKHVKDPAMLEQVNVSDNVKLSVAKIDGAYTIPACQRCDITQP